MPFLFALPCEMPPGYGIAIFSPIHLLWLTVSLVSMYFIAHLFRRLGQTARRALLQSLAAVLVGIEVARDLWLFLDGRYDPAYMLPLHLCGVMIFVEALAVFRGGAFLSELSFCLGMPGAFFALITPGETEVPFMNLYYWHFILMHYLLVLIPILMLVDGFTPNPRRKSRCFAFLLCLAAFDTVVNGIFGGNYLFLGKASPGSLLDVISSFFGPFYVPAVAAAVWICWALLYLPWQSHRLSWFTHQPKEQSQNE